MSDQLYYSDTLDLQQWLIFYISKPLYGLYEPIKINPAVSPSLVQDNGTDKATAKPSFPDAQHSTIGSSSSDRKKDIRGFNDVLGQFPLIARQMQGGLEKAFRDARKEMKEHIQSKISRRPSDASISSLSSKQNGSIHSKLSNGHTKSPVASHLRVDEDEEGVRRSVEVAVSSAINLFQQVDKQQLSVLGSTTKLTGPAVELLIERYVAEQMHESVLFPFMCDKRKLEDLDLESRIHGMQNIDLAQVGISIDGGRAEKTHLAERIEKGVEEFRKLGVSGSPQQMIEILLNTQKLITTPERSDSSDDGVRSPDTEKKWSPMTTNADTLVSLLLLVVIRSQVHHLNARFSYMRNFVFIDDVEAGEIGYALSTFEAVLAYLAVDSGGLRRASKKNKVLWDSIKHGAIDEIRAILDPSKHSDISRLSHDVVKNHDIDWDSLNLEKDSGADDDLPRKDSVLDNENFALLETSTSTLAHVFPFQVPSTPKKKKRVSMDTRSFSNSSEISFVSRSTTLDSRTSAIEGDISIATLSQTQNEDGHSLLMMAVEARQAEALEYLLSLEDLFPTQFILGDTDKNNTTLLSAAIQLGNKTMIDPLVRRILEFKPSQDAVHYFQRADKHGRSVAHYLFNAPYLISDLREYIEWNTKDKNGQTPLFALCRSYDHPEYSEMVNQALQYATLHQADGEPLRIDDHVDIKGNSLLHVINDPTIALRILKYCDSDANATNDKRFTPLMMASKYGRMDMVRALFGDQRVDVLAKEQRGMTAVELAKDDEVRNRIDDMMLVSNIAAADGRVTAVVRSFFVDDASLRMIIKSAVHSDNGMIGVSTCRRSLTDFENLAKWLAVEHPASWLPSIFNFRPPFQIPSRPSRAVLQDIQIRLDRFLKIMLAHSTFSTHELLWEFILFPEIQPEMMAERSRKKAEIRVENIHEEYEPVTDVREVSSFVEHARESIRAVSHSTKSITRRVEGIRLGLSSK